MKTFVLLSIAILYGMSQASAQSSEIFKTKEGIAIKGYDPVAFFTQQKAVKGTDSLNLSWKGANWLFSSAENRERFRKDPEQYAPQFGGYCAYGLAGNHKAPTETDTWTVINDRLYFNYNQSVRKLWLKDTVQFIQQANINWEKIRFQ